MDILSLLLLLHCTAVTVSQSCTNGEVEIFGVETDTLIAGRLEICVGREWFAVYDKGWGEHDVEVVCRQKEFPANGASYCKGSCFGASQLTQGYEDFHCGGDRNPQRLIDCDDEELVNEPRTSKNAGVICKKTPGQAITQCHIIPEQDPITTQYTPTNPSNMSPTPCDYNSSYSTTIDKATPLDYSTTSTGGTGSGSVANEQDSETNCMTLEDRNGLIATTAVLGVLSALLLLTLVGVIIALAWSCHKNRDRVKQKPSRSNNTLNNPTYTPTTPLTTSTYGMLGPRDAPTTGHTPLSREEREVIVVNYEVPVQSESESMERYEMPPAQVYNTLHHL